MFEVVETGLKKSTFAEPRIGKPSRQADVSQESVEPPEQDPPSPKGGRIGQLKRQVLAHQRLASQSRPIWNPSVTPTVIVLCFVHPIFDL